MKKYIFLLVLILEFSTIMSAYSIENIEINGKKVEYILEQNSMIPAVSLELVFKKSGEINENRYEISSLPKLTQKILNEGTKTLGSIEFAELLEEKAIHLSTGVGRETFVINLDSLKENFDFGVNAVVSLLKDPNLTTDTLKKVLTRLHGSLLSSKNNYDFLSSLNLNNLIFQDTIYQKTDLDSRIENIVETLKSEEKLEKTIEAIQVYINEFINLNRVLPVIAGQISKAEADEYLTKILSVLSTNEVKEKNLDTFEKITATDKQINSKVIKEDTKQAYIYFGSPFKIHDNLSVEDDAKIKLFSFILGASGFGSRLMDEIRTKHGLAYSVVGAVSKHKSGIYFYGHLQTGVENEEKAIELLKKIISEFTEKGITADELQSAKNFIIGSEPLRYETTAQKIGKIFTNHYNNREKDYSVKLLEAIENTKLDDLNKFISQHKEINLLSFSILTSK